MASNREAELVLKRMEKDNHPAVDPFLMKGLANSLQLETREAWPIQRVRQEFLLPLIRKMLKGATQLQAESEVWKELGIADRTRHRRELQSERDPYGRRKKERSG